MKLLSVLFASLLLVPGLVAENNEPIVEVAPYLAGSIGDQMVMCDVGKDFGVIVGNIGGTCHAVPATAGTVNVWIDDLLGDVAPTGFFLAWTVGPEERIDQQFCAADNGIGVPVPAGATELRVFVNGPLTSLSCGDTGAGTAGDITVQWNIRSGKDGR